LVNFGQLTNWLINLAKIFPFNSPERKQTGQHYGIFMSRRPFITTLIGSLCIFLVARLTVGDPLSYVINPQLWQLTSPAWITGKSLWSTVLSFHAQPPGLLVLQWFEANLAAGIIHYTLVLAAAVFVCCSGVIATGITNSWKAGLLTTMIVAFQPATLLYSHWFFSSIYLAALLSLSVVSVQAWARTGKGILLVAAAFALALASLFHAAYLLAFVVLIFLALGFPKVRNVELRRLKFAVPLLLATAIAFFTPVKNLTVFGFFSTSSWAPLNLANDYTDERFIWQKCQSKVLHSDRQPGDYSDSAAAAYRGILNKDMLFQPRKPGGRVNLNHLDVMQCIDGSYFLEEFDITSAFLNIARAISETIALPAWDYQWLGQENLKKILNTVRLYELYVTRAHDVDYRYYMNIEKRPDGWLRSLPSFASVLFSVTVIFSCTILMAGFIQFWRRAGRDEITDTMRAHIARIYPCVLALLVLTIFVFASGQELNRVKFSLTPLFIAIMFGAMQRCAPIWLRRLRTMRLASETP